jgi:hypothetical protein
MTPACPRFTKIQQSIRHSSFSFPAMLDLADRPVANSRARKFCRAICIGAAVALLAGRIVHAEPASTSAAPVAPDPVAATVTEAAQLAAARSVFLSYGFKRVSMNDIAYAAGVSRPALYVLFKNKEEIFIAAYLRWVEETIAQVEAGMAQTTLPKDKLARAFDIWAVGPFEMTRAALAAEELVNCNFPFAEAARNHGNATF